MAADPIDLDTLPGQGSIIIAFSGGPDSVCLLHQLRQRDTQRTIACIHVDHGLDRDSAERARRAAAIAASLGAECDVVRIEVRAGRGPEARAREARYRALKSKMAAGDVLLTAHHADDQVETVLLRLLRGAGPEGLSGIPARRRFGPGWLVRPLLEWSRQEIDDWLQRHDLPFIRDPANLCLDFDRNHLRHEILPALRRRWPGVQSALQRSARLCGGAADVIARRVEADLETASGGHGTLDVRALAHRGDYYLGAAIRAWSIHEGVEPPPGRRLDDFVQQTTSAGGDRIPQLRWDHNVLRYWKHRLWLDVEETATGGWAADWDGRAPIGLPGGLGTLCLQGPARPPLSLTVRSGRPGDRLRPDGDPHHRDCKRLLADAGVPPWQRDQWPRLCLDGQLVALGTRWRTSQFRRLLEGRHQLLTWEPGARRLTGGAGLESPP